MSNYTPLLSILVAGFGLAFLFGYLAHRIKLSPIVGYLMAGIVIGPSTPGYIADPQLSSELAEIGVILLMFGIGLHFSLTDLNAVKKIVIPGATAQILLSALLGTCFGLYQHWEWPSAFLFGLAISVASTVVLLRTLEDLNLLKTREGHLAVGWLVVEDLVMVSVLILLPPLAIILGRYQPDPTHLSFLDRHMVILFTLTVFKISTFILAMFVFGRKLLPLCLQHIEKNSSNELFRLSILSVALAIAFIAAKLFDVSFALGAFFAGMILSESPLSHRAAEEILPLRDAFSVLFFISVGMLFHPGTLITQPKLLILTTLLIMLGKSCLAFLLVLSFRYTVATACMIALSLAQIGEFSFILATLGCKLNLLSSNVKDLIIAGAILSMILNPILFRLMINRTPARLKRHVA